MNKRKFIQLKQKYFIENGGLLFQPKLANHKGSMYVTNIFSAEEKTTTMKIESLVKGALELFTRGY